MAPSITEPSNFAASKSSGEVRAVNDDSLWNVSSIPGKGKALLATRRIYPGALILSEAPLITTEAIHSADTIEKDLASALKALPKESQRAFLSLHNNYPGKNPLQNIIRSNGYPLGPGADVGGVFATISRINHSCLPNSVHSWNEIRGQETVYAVREIQEGEEITLSYHAGGPSATRKELLLENFGFTCTCELCSLPAEQLNKSDARLIRAHNLDSTIGDAATVRNSPSKVLKNCKTLKELYDQEGIKDDRISRLWYDCFQVCNMHGDEARASVFARRYVEAKLVSAGSDGTDVLEMMPFVKHPRKHSSFEEKGKWKTSVSDLPKELSDGEFESWLWNRGT